MAYWNDSGSAANVFDRLGSPGKWYGALKCTNNTTTVFTGSFYGGAAILLNGNGSHANTAITTVGGAIITGDDLTAGVLYEIAPSKVVTANNTDATVYVFKGNA
tara:strand:+ start:275 stop:586 length:312 start_codon:yes stop_codon:yes gene_type:complete